MYVNVSISREQEISIGHAHTNNRVTKASQPKVLQLIEAVSPVKRHLLSERRQGETTLAFWSAIVQSFIMLRERGELNYPQGSGLVRKL